MKIDVPRSLCILVLVSAGCAGPRAVLSVPVTPDTQAVATEYRIGCPDVLAVAVDGRPHLDAVASVDVDGRLPFAGSKPRLEGLTLEEARIVLARVIAVESSTIFVHVGDPRSARVYVTGPDNRRTRVLAHAGPERVLEFLQRTGALQPAATKLNDVYVVRSHVTAGTPAEVFHIDVEAVVLDGDNATNVEVQSGDRIYIGETRRSSFARLLPPWLRPVYRRLTGLVPS